MELVGISNTDFAEQLFEQWKDDTASVPPEWDSYFRALDNGTDATTDVTALAKAAAASAARSLPQATGTGAVSASPQGGLA